jgi:hypothetical protein
MKWETPHLNFNNTTIRPVDSDHGLTIPTLGSESVPRGIWRQFGLIPQGDEGIYVGIDDIPTNWLQYNWYARSGSNVYTRGAKTGADGVAPLKLPRAMKSLVDLLGFEKAQKKLGRLKTIKTVREAIVAVPFIECEGARKFFEINRDTINLATGATTVQETNPEFSQIGTFGTSEPGASITDMVQKMSRYVFPPKMDFLKYTDITPFAMYIFEFEFKFDQDDLSYLWQNCAPRNHKTFQESSATISHLLLNNELMGLTRAETGQNFQDKVQWMVFKVKQRALGSYDALSSDQARGAEPQYGQVVGNDIVLESGFGTIDPEAYTGYDYTYNWPYDYFSFVELAKIQSEILFGGTPATTPDRPDPDAVSTSNGQNKNSGVSATEGTEGRMVTGVSTLGGRGGGSVY